MGRKDRFREDRAFLEGVLNAADDMALAMNDGEKGPYVIAVHHVLVKGALYVHAAFEGRKMDLIRRNPHVGFTAYTDVRILREKAATSFRSVCGTGTASIVDDPEEKRAALDAITLRFRSRCPRPAPEAMIARVAIIRIDIDSLMGKHAPVDEQTLKT